MGNQKTCSATRAYDTILECLSARSCLRQGCISGKHWQPVQAVSDGSSAKSCGLHRSGAATELMKRRSVLILTAALLSDVAAFHSSPVRAGKASRGAAQLRSSQESSRGQQRTCCWASGQVATCCRPGSWHLQPPTVPLPAVHQGGPNRFDTRFDASLSSGSSRRALPCRLKGRRAIRNRLHSAGPFCCTDRCARAAQDD